MDDNGSQYKSTLKCFRRQQGRVEAGERPWPKFDAHELFESLSDDEKESISSAIDDASKIRERGRYERLEVVEDRKNSLIQELKHIEYAIAENDAWFRKAKDLDAKPSKDELQSHRSRAGELYTRRKHLTDHLIPEAETAIEALLNQIKREELREPWFQRQDLERSLLPIFEKREWAKREVAVERARERTRKNRQLEAEREAARAAFLERLRAGELEKARRNAEEQRINRAKAIRAEVEKRRIPYLVHFTPLRNVASILRDGLQSRNALGTQPFIYTDEYRSDGWLDWISTSISFPNYRMFYAKRNTLREVDAWAILLIKREVMWDLDCKFILTNASSYGIRMFSDEKWSSVQALEEMFGRSEHRLGIPDWYPTDPQAEVMIRNEVPRDYIGAVAVAQQEDLLRLGDSPGIKALALPDLFKWRADYEHWRQRHLSPPRNESIAFISS